METQRPLALLSNDDGYHSAGIRAMYDALATTMDVVMLASHREGFPRTPMEAAAMGRPVVATDIRGCRQVVDHGTTGLLVPVRDPRALADAAGALARDPARRQRFGAAAREKAAREFDDRRCVQITLDTYHRLLAQRAPAAAPA